MKKIRRRIARKRRRHNKQLEPFWSFYRWLLYRHIRGKDVIGAWNRIGKRKSQVIKESYILREVEKDISALSKPNINDLAIIASIRSNLGRKFN